AGVDDHELSTPELLRAAGGGAVQTWTGVGRYLTQFAPALLAAGLLHRRTRAAAVALTLAPAAAAWRRRTSDIDPVRFTGGDVAVARAAAARGTAIGLSSFASRPVEDVVAANPMTLFQLYWSGTKEQILQRLDRARTAGAAGVIITLDWSFSMGRDWGSPHIP